MIAGRAEGDQRNSDVLARVLRCAALGHSGSGFRGSAFRLLANRRSQLGKLGEALAGGGQLLLVRAEGAELEPGCSTTGE